MRPTGYFNDDLGRTYWVPPGWNYSPPVLVTDRYEHSQRVTFGRTQQGDWPRFLLARFNARQPKPWRLVLVDPYTGQRGESYWLDTYERALAIAEQARVAWVIKTQEELT